MKTNRMFAVFAALFVFFIACVLSAQQTVVTPEQYKAALRLAEAVPPNLIEKFEDFDLILSQDGEKIEADVPQLKAAIVTIMSPQSGEDFESYGKRADGFRGDYQSAPKNYSSQVLVIRAYYEKLTGKKLEELSAPAACQPEENILVVARSEVDLEPGQVWSEFSEFRHNPLGDEISGAGTNEEIFARVRKAVPAAVEQVLRTSYHPYFKTRWVEVLRAFEKGSTGEDAGSPRIETVKRWSNFWEITRGKNSVLENAEFKPTPQWENAKAIVFKLPGFCREVGHALPCGLNPIVPKYRTVISTTRKEVEYVNPPAKCNCTLQASKGNVPLSGESAQIHPDEVIHLNAKVEAAETIQVVTEQWWVDGQLRAANQKEFDFKPTLVDFRTGTYNIEYRLTDQFGRVTVCKFTVTIKAKPAPVISYVPPTPPPPPVRDTHKEKEPKKARCGTGCKVLIAALIAGAAVGACAAAGCFGGGHHETAPPVAIKPPIGAPGVTAAIHTMGGVGFSWGRR